MRYVPKRPKLDPCPVEEVLGLVAGKWKARIIFLLHLEYTGFSELRRALPGVTQQVLAAQLAALVEDGVVTKTIDAKSGSPRYGLTPEGQALLPLLMPICVWGMERLGRRGLTWSPPPWADGEPVDLAFLKGAPPRRERERAAKAAAAAAPTRTS